MKYNVELEGKLDELETKDSKVTYDRPASPTEGRVASRRSVQGSAVNSTRCSVKPLKSPKDMHPLGSVGLHP